MITHFRRTWVKKLKIYHKLCDTCYLLIIRTKEYDQIKKEETLDDILVFDNLQINRALFEDKCDGKIVDLSAREYELLEFFALNPNQVFSREDLLRKVWNYEYLGDIRTVDVTISRLRDKLNVIDTQINHIRTKRGFGYYFV